MYLLFLVILMIGRFSTNYKNLTSTYKPPVFKLYPKVYIGVLRNPPTPFSSIKIFLVKTELNKKFETMKIEKNFKIGVLSGICGILLVFLITGSTNPNTTTKFEFHDLGDTRGLHF